MDKLVENVENIGLSTGILPFQMAKAVVEKAVDNVDNPALFHTPELITSPSAFPATPRKRERKIGFCHFSGRSGGGRTLPLPTIFV